MTIFERLGAHFAAFPYVTQIQTGQITIGRETYPCARYVVTLNTPEGTPAYARGEREYTREFIYCVGMLPSAQLRGNVAFTIEGNSLDWYVATYFGAVSGRTQARAEPNEFHPFGNSFMLAPWGVKDGTKIDTYARVPYRRMSATLGRNWVCRKAA